MWSGELSKGYPLFHQPAAKLFSGMEVAANSVARLSVLMEQDGELGQVGTQRPTLHPSSHLGLRKERIEHDLLLSGWLP